MPLDFLLQLPKFCLPYKVTAPDELRWVCVLTCTGLIESESWPRLKMTQRFQPIKYAWVEQITSDGLEEIARLKSQAGHASEVPPEATRTLNLRVANPVEMTSWLQAAVEDFSSPTQLLGPETWNTERPPKTLEHCMPVWVTDQHIPLHARHG